MLVLSSRSFELGSRSFEPRSRSFESVPLPHLCHSKNGVSGTAVHGFHSRSFELFFKPDTDVRVTGA